jgi:hypothetical protein
MNIDLLGGIFPPQTIDIKTEKNTGHEDTRAIEESNKSDNLELNINQKALMKRPKMKGSSETIEVKAQTYNANGDVAQDAKTSADNPHEAIHFVV